MMGFLASLFKKGEPKKTPESAPGYAHYNLSGSAWDIARKVEQKDYQAAINRGIKALEQNPHDAMLHINLMNAYLKGRDLSPDYIDRATEEARLAMLCGHHTGLAEKVLAVNLEKKLHYHQALQLYDLILEHPKFHFSPHGIGRTIDFKARREKVRAKLSKAVDLASDTLFTAGEIETIIRGIETAERNEKRRQKEFEAKQRKRLKELEKLGVDITALKG